MATTARRWSALVLLAAGLLAGAPPAHAATTFGVEVRPATGGTAGAPVPVTIAVRAAVSADSAGALPPAVQGLAIQLPDGFATALAGTATCARSELASRGSSACPPASKLGSGGGSFLYVVGALRIPASTQELSLFRGPGSELHMYLRVTQPATLAVVVPGTLTVPAAPAGPIVAFDVGEAAQVAGGGSVIVTRADFDVQRGLAAGPCTDGRWTFRARLAFAGGAVEDRSADARCEIGADTTPPVLRASARNGTPALGARLPIRLSEPARVSVTLDRRAGRRWVRVRRVAFRAGAGSSTLRIRRVRGRPLARGGYRARLSARDAAGLASSTRTVTFRLR